MKIKSLFILIIVLSLFLRIFQLDKTPPSLFADEVDLGYQAYSVLNTGRDYSGNPLPVHFESFADFRTPLYIYSVVPLLKIFGLNEWSVRLPAALFGVAGIVGIYFLVRFLGLNKWVGLTASFLMAISPWHLQYSRAGFEVTLMLALLIWAIIFFLKGLEQRKFLLISAGLFALTIYSYSTAKLFVPVFFLGLLFLYKDKVFKLPKNTIISLLAILFLVGLPFLIDLKNGQAIYRFSYTSIFANPTIPQEIDVERQVDGPVNFQSKLLHNKLLSLADIFTKNYLSAFSTNFLFLQGDPIGRHSVGKMGEFFPVEVITILTGLLWILKKATKQVKFIIFAWLILAPIPAALTMGGGSHGSRLFFMLPPLIILSSTGAYFLFETLWKKRLTKGILFILCLVLAFNLYTYFHQYYIHYPKEQERFWHFGFKQAILKAETLKSSYDRVVLTQTTEPPLIFLLFWTNYDPGKFQSLGGKVTKLDKYYISSFDPLMTKDEFGIIDNKTLVIANRKDISGDLRREKKEGLKLVDIVEFPSGEVAFYLLTKE